MVQPGELIRRQEERPFRPFRVHLSDGSTVEVPFVRFIVCRDEVVLPAAFEWEQGLRLMKRYRRLPLPEIIGISDMEARQDFDGHLPL